MVDSTIDYGRLFEFLAIPSVNEANAGTSEDAAKVMFTLNNREVRAARGLSEQHRLELRAARPHIALVQRLLLPAPGELPAIEAELARLSTREAAAVRAVADYLRDPD
jgi:hypothetical protein